MQAIQGVLGDARTVINVGAGTGNYEPPDREVVGVEPSTVMIAQRPSGTPPVIGAAAEALPVRNGAFDAALAVLTTHHWDDVSRGLAELRRVAERQVIVTFDPDRNGAFWLVRDYLGASIALDRARTPSLATLEDHLGPLQVQPLPVPRDMQDGVLAAYWARPHAYLDAEVRANISSFAQLAPDTVDRAMRALAEDLADGTWERRNVELRNLDAYDAGYQLISAGADRT